MFPIFKLDIGRGSAWKLPETLVDQMAQSPAAFYTLLQLDVHQSQTSQLPHFWNALVLWASRQFFQKYQPGVLILGKTHQRTGKGKRLWGKDALRSPTQCRVWSLQLQFSWPEKPFLTACTFSFLHGMRTCYSTPLNLWRKKNLHERRRGKDRTNKAKVKCVASQLPHGGTFIFPGVQSNNSIRLTQLSRLPF